MLSGVQTLGAGPRFKRKRSFWRAHRRGESYAVMSYYTASLFDYAKAALFKIMLNNIKPDRNCRDGEIYLIRKRDFIPLAKTKTPA